MTVAVLDPWLIAGCSRFIGVDRLAVIVRNDELVDVMPDEFVRRIAEDRGPGWIYTLEDPVEVYDHEKIGRCFPKAVALGRAFGDLLLESLVELAQFRFALAHCSLSLTPSADVACCPEPLDDLAICAQ